MPKVSNLPTILDDCLKICISDLKKWDYLIINQIKSGVFTWNRNGNKTASISFKVNTMAENYYIELDYKANDKPILYCVQLITKPSNLGKGIVWYFLCPETNKLCRKLYLVGNYFLHRSAFQDCFYEKQTHSHKTRNLINPLKMVFKLDEMYERLYKKYAKSYYNGKPTKYQKKIEKLEKQVWEKLPKII